MAVSQSIRRSLRRWRASALPIFQCAIAAAVAWWVATEVIGHQTPFFAPMAAVISLGLSLGARFRRSIELVAGVSIGIGVGDLLINRIGAGSWQIALVVFLAMSAAVLLDSGVIIALQAGTSSILVATLLPPGGSGGYDRMVDALVGGIVGVAVVAVLPSHPVSQVRSDAADILATATEVLRGVVTGLERNDEPALVVALRLSRTTQPGINKLRDHVRGGREISRISPFYWSSRSRIASIAAIVDPLDNAMRNIRVLARRSLTVVRDDEVLDPRLVAEIDRTADSVQVLRQMLQTEHGQKPDQADAARVLRSAASGMKPELLDGAGLSATVVFAQLRSLLVDLLQVAGLQRISAIATLPPTTEHPAYPPEL